MVSFFSIKNRDAFGFIFKLIFYHKVFRWNTNRMYSTIFFVFKW